LPPDRPFGGIRWLGSMVKAIPSSVFDAFAERPLELAGHVPIDDNKAVNLTAFCFDDQQTHMLIRAVD